MVVMTRVEYDNLTHVLLFCATRRDLLRAVERVLRTASSTNACQLYMLRSNLETMYAKTFDATQPMQPLHVLQYGEKFLNEWGHTLLQEMGLGLLFLEPQVSDVKKKYLQRRTDECRRVGHVPEVDGVPAYVVCVFRGSDGGHVFHLGDSSG